MNSTTIELGRPEKLTGEITAGMKMAQEFEAPMEVLRTVSINFATYKRLNRCTLQVAVKDMEGITLTYCHVNGRAVADNAYTTVPVNAKLEIGKRYLLVLAGVDGQPGFCPTAKFGTSDGRFAYQVGMTPVPGMNLCCKLYFEEAAAEQKPPEPQKPQPTIQDLIDKKVKIEDYNPEASPEETESALDNYFKKNKKNKKRD